MIAEIHHKISSSGTNLSDRLEDQLTGNVFGTLRYLPFEEGIAPILCQSKIKINTTNDSFNTLLHITKEYDYVIRFWENSAHGEIDLVIETENLLIGIEVKYLSGISSDDEVDNSTAKEIIQSNHQLARYSRFLDESNTTKEKMLIFLAPADMGLAVLENIQKRNLIHKNIPLALLSWQDIFIKLQEMTEKAQSQVANLIYEDIIMLLAKKGFEMFNGFNGSQIQKVKAEEIYRYNEESTFSWQNKRVITKGVSYDYKNG